MSGEAAAAVAFEGGAVLFSRPKPRVLVPLAAGLLGDAALSVAVSPFGTRRGVLAQHAISIADTTVYYQLVELAPSMAPSNCQSCHLADAILYFDLSIHKARSTVYSYS